MKKKRHQQISAKIVINAILTLITTGIISAIRTTPLGVMLLAGIVFYKVESLPTSLVLAIPTISYMILIFGMAVTSCFSRSRFFFMLLILFLSQLGMDALASEHMDKIFAL